MPTKFNLTPMEREKSLIPIKDLAERTLVRMRSGQLGVVALSRAERAPMSCQKLIVYLTDQDGQPRVWVGPSTGIVENLGIFSAEDS